MRETIILKHNAETYIKMIKEKNPKFDLSKWVNCQIEKEYAEVMVGIFEGELNTLMYGDDEESDEDGGK